MSTDHGFVKRGTIPSLDLQTKVENTQITFPNSDTYSGGIRNGALEGEGSYSFANGAIFKGNFQHGKPNGIGTLTYSNGCKYEGQFKDGKRHGKGVLAGPNGTVYDGDWVEGSQTGIGKFTWSEEDEDYSNCVYIGSFVDGSLNGEGTYLYSNGDKYQGGFNQGRMHGKGVYSCANGDETHGEWYEGNLHGVATVRTAKDSAVWETKYVNGDVEYSKHVGYRQEPKAQGEPRTFVINEDSYLGLVRENQQLKVKLKDTLDLLQEVYSGVAIKESQFQESIADTKKMIEEMRSISEARIAELTEKYNEAYKKSQFIERFKNQFDADDPKLSRRALRPKGSVSDLNINPIPTSPTDRMFTSRDGPVIDFSKIQFHELIGRGGSGSIYRCTANGFSFATKTISIEFMGDEELNQIKKEVNIMKTVNSPFTARCLGSAQDEVSILIFMEYYKTTLNSVILKRREESNPFTLENICWFAYQICEGLKYLHNLQPPVIHRDLKSENIFYVDMKGGMPVLRIGDFGEAKPLHAKMTHTINLGTDEFRAPEVYGMMTAKEGEKGHNEKADIWSFGMVLFEMMTLDIPYRPSNSKKWFGIAEWIEKGIRPTFPERVLQDPSLEPLLMIFAECTVFEPSKRPTAKELAKKFKKLYEKAVSIKKDNP